MTQNQSQNQAENQLPLAGIRVVDLSRVFAMPYAGSYLASLGAEVIKIDTHHAQFVDTTRTLNGPYPDNQAGTRYWDRGGTFQTLNRGKRSLTLDLRSDAALGLLKGLVGVSDIVLENFTPRVMARFGLDYSSLKLVRPDLIMVSNTGYGHSGPWSNFGAMATALEPTHGSGAFMGYWGRDGEGSQKEGEVPNKVGNSYTDFLATWTALLAVMVSLIHRRRTGQGQWIDLAMYQAGVSFGGAGVLEYAFNGQRTRRIGNSHIYMCPHGCYPSLGEDQWVTLAVRDDADWLNFCQVIGSPELLVDPRFASFADRLSHREELDHLIGHWTSSRTSYEAMEQLQSRGVPAGPVLNAKQLLTDPHFRERGFFESVKHVPEVDLGEREYLGRGWKLSANEIKQTKGAPQLGEANGYVLKDILGLSSGEIDRLEQEGVIGNQLAGGAVPALPPLEQQVELGWLASFDSNYR